MPQADMNSEGSNTELLSEPAHTVQAGPGLHLEQEVAGQDSVSRGGPTEESAGSPSSVQDGPMPVTVKEPQNSTSPAEMTPPETGLASSSRDSPAIVEHLPSCTDGDMMAVQLNNPVLEGRQEDMRQQPPQQQQPDVCMPKDQQMTSSTGSDMMSEQLNESVLEGRHEDKLQQHQPQQQPDVCMPEDQQMASSTNSDMVHVQLNTSVPEGPKEDLQQQQQQSPQQQQPDLCMPEERECTATMAAIDAPQPPLSVDRAVRVVFGFGKQDAEQAEKMVKVTLHVGRFCYNKETLLKVRNLIAHDRMPTNWRPVQPGDEFVLKIYEALLDERSSQGGARRTLVPPQYAGPAPQGHDSGWRGAQRQTQLPPPRHPWIATNGPPGGPLPPPQPAKAPPVHHEDSWLTTLNKLPAPPGIPRPAGSEPMSGHRGPVLGQFGRPVQQLTHRDSSEPRPALGQPSRPQAWRPIEDANNGEFVMPKRPQPSLFVDEDEQWPAERWEQNFPPLQPHGAPAGRPHPKLHQLQSSRRDDAAGWSIPAVNGPPMHDVSEDALETLRQAGIRLGDDCMSLLGGLPVDTQKACVLPLIQAANRTGKQSSSMFMGVIFGVAAVQGENADETASKAADSASTAAPKNLHAPPGFQAAAPGGATETPTSADDSTDKSTQSSGNRGKRPPPGFEDWQHVQAPSAVVSLESANSIRENPVTAMGRSTARPVSRASSRASSGELDHAILAMLLPKAPEQDVSDAFGGVIKRGTQKTAEDAQNNRAFWDRPSGISDRDLLEDMQCNNHSEGIRRSRSSHTDLRRRYSGGLPESDGLETGSAASDSLSESTLYSRLFGFLKGDLETDRTWYPPHMRKPNKVLKNMDSRTGGDLRGLQNGSTSTQPVPSASKEQEPHNMYERLKKALKEPSQPSAQQPRMSVFDRLGFPPPSQPEASAQQEQTPPSKRKIRPPVLQDTDFALSGPSQPVAEQTRMSVFDRLTSPQTSQPETPTQQIQKPAPQRMMRPPVLQDSDFVLRNFDTPLSRISEASEHSDRPSTGAKKSHAQSDGVREMRSSPSHGFPNGLRSKASPFSASACSEPDSNEPGAEQESALMTATAVAILDLVHPQGRKHNPMAAQQWTALSPTIKSALTSTTDERIINAATGHCAEEAEDLTKSLALLLEPVHAAHHPETAACWRVLTSQEKLQVKDDLLDGWRMHLGMLQPRRRALAQRMAAQRPSADGAHARIAGMCPQLRDMLLLLLDATDSSVVLDAVVAALTGMEKYRGEYEVDSMRSSKTVTYAHARNAQVQNDVHGHSQPPNMYPMSQTAGPTASAQPIKGPGGSNSSQYPDWLQILLTQEQPPPKPKPVPQAPLLTFAIPSRPQPKNTYAATLIAPPVVSSRVIDDGKRKREAAPAAPAAPATKPGKKKPWWETEQGAEELAGVQEVYGGRRNADNTFAVEREIDEFEELGLLEPSVFQGDTKKKKRSKAPTPAQQYAAPRQIKRLAGSPAYNPRPAQRAPQPQAWKPPPMTTAAPPMPIGPPPSLAPPPPGFASVLARLSHV